jgi:uncharacterized protein involved in exopolysaccharide biosynthesis
MQEVYKDGTLGKEKDLNDYKELLEALKNQNVDHIRVFEKEKGNKVGIAEIQEAMIKKIVEKKLGEREKIKNVQEEYEYLTREFDRKSKLKFKNKR